jgi:hypothetical protein
MFQSSCVYLQQTQRLRRPSHVMGWYGLGATADDWLRQWRRTRVENARLRAIAALRSEGRAIPGDVVAAGPVPAQTPAAPPVTPSNNAASHAELARLQAERDDIERRRQNAANQAAKRTQQLTEEQAARTAAEQALAAAQAEAARVQAERDAIDQRRVAAANQAVKRTQQLTEEQSENQALQQALSTAREETARVQAERDAIDQRRVAAANQAAKRTQQLTDEQSQSAELRAQLYAAGGGSFAVPQPNYSGQSVASLATVEPVSAMVRRSTGDVVTSATRTPGASLSPVVMIGVALAAVVLLASGKGGRKARAA